MSDWFAAWILGVAVLELLATGAVIALLYMRLPWMFKNPLVHELKPEEEQEVTTIGRKVIKPWDAR